MPSRVAELLGLPELGYARALELSGVGPDAGGAGAVLRAQRSMGDTLETLEAALPAVATVVSEINEPRIPTLMNIMKAGKKPVAELSLADLSLDAAALAPLRAIKSNLAEEQSRKRVLFDGDPGRPGRGLDQRAGRRRRPGKVRAMTAILVCSEQLDTAFELLGAAQTLAPQLDLTVSAAVLGAEAAAQAAALAARGAAPVYLCTEPALEGLDTAVTAQALAHVAEQAGASLVLLGSTRRGRELAGRLAQRLGAGCVTDASSLAVEDGLLVAGRYNLGGATVQREALTSAVQVVAVMPKVFAADEAGSAAAGAGAGADAGAGAAADAIVNLSLGLPAPAVRVVERRPKEGEAVDLSVAARIVGVGRGLARRDDVTLGESLAAALGAELACTKSLADFGWMSDDRIVGLSGAKTSPEVYLAVGISGQVQHTVGMAQARVVAVVNQDKDAPIFALADYGVIGDLYRIVPALIERLKTL